MTSGDGWLLAAAGIALVLASLLACAETAVSRLSNVQVEQLRREGKRSAAGLAVLVADRPRYINALLLSHNTLFVLSVVLVQHVASEMLPVGLAVLVTVLGMAALFFMVVGVAARTIGKQHTYAVASAFNRPIRGLGWLLSPLTRLLILLGNAFTPGKGFPEGPFASQAELREFLDQAEAASLIEDDERQMIHSVFDLGDTIAREVMVPRTEIVFIEQDRTLRQALSLGLRSGCSRIPVIGASADEVLGVVYLKDVTKRTFEHRQAESEETVDSVMRPPYFVPESKNADELLRQMQADRVHMGIVVDEFGGTAGLVTIEDILEEIVGEITDEYDDEIPDVAQLADGAWRVSSRLAVEDLAALIGIELSAEADQVETVGGLLALRLGKVPIPGASVRGAGLGAGGRVRRGTAEPGGDRAVPASGGPRSSGGAGR